MSTSEKPGLLPAGLGKLSPWGSRSGTPVDHVIIHKHRLGLKYPHDCPPLDVRWFFAVDVAKRKPLALNSNKSAPDSKPAIAPKKFEQFALHDSRSLEAAFQRDLDGENTGEENEEKNVFLDESLFKKTDKSTTKSKALDINPKGGNDAQVTKRPTSSHDVDSDLASKKLDSHRKRPGPKVPVQEDYLFDVDINERELYPAYWLGPVYEVRRGTWFYQEGTNFRPCEENLATQLEEGFLKIAPFRRPPLEVAPQTSNDLQSDSLIVKTQPTEDSSGQDVSTVEAIQDTVQTLEDSQARPLEAYRLFGAYMNTFVTYEDSKTAWLQTDSVISRVSSTMYERFGGGSHLGGTKVVRGFVEPKAKKSKNRDSLSSNISSKEEATEEIKVEETQLKQPADPPKLSSDLTGTVEALDLLKRVSSGDIGEDTVRQLEQHQIQEDYRNPKDNEQDREIEHLLLVSHGIGQKLGLRMESINFIHDVNVLRKTLKAVYASSEDLQALNQETDKLPKNCRIQVLPVCWRHLLDFPRRSLRENRREHDLGDAEAAYEEEQYPSLQDITVEGIPQVRNLISDLGLDILLYQSSYREHISEIVLKESNRVYELFLKRTPGFKGKVHLVGHSLGSAIFFDLLCRQRSESLVRKPRPKKPRTNYSHHREPSSSLDGDQFALSFKVDHFYCLGSPIALFQMLKGRTIASRKYLNDVPPTSPPDSSSSLPPTVSSPECGQLFNIFHPSDPIAYRIEPLISFAMSSLKPQPLPYKKKTIFAAPAAGLSELGNRVSQGVTGLWSSLSTGIASGILNRSLGLTADQSDPMSKVPPNNDNADPSSASIVGSPSSGDMPTVINPEIETLYSGFQKSQRVAESVNDSPARAKREESKVNALNSNGRVDYSIQEGVFDISLLASIQSHLAYWGDEDVNHFMLSQLLSKRRTASKH